MIEDTSNGEVIIIDTKWKNPGNASPSVQDLRQMYTYNRFWNASKAILLYPGEQIESDFQEFLNVKDPMPHHCKMAFVNVLTPNGELDKDIGESIIAELEWITDNKSY